MPVLSLSSTCCITSWHHTLFKPMHFLTQEKVVTCCVTLVGQLVTTGATCMTHVQGRRHNALGWTCPPHFWEVVLETDANPDHERLNLYMLAYSSSALLEQTRRDTRDKHDTLSRCARHDMSCVLRRFVTWRNKWNLRFTKHHLQITYILWWLVLNSTHL